jgi:hypothetical protein
MSRIVIVILKYYRREPIDSINLLGSEWRCYISPVMCGQTCRVEFYIKERWIMPRIAMVI